MKKVPLHIDLNSLLVVILTFFANQWVMADQKGVPAYKTLHSATVNLILPAHQKLSVDIDSLSQTVAQHCDDPKVISLDNVRAHWKNAMSSWSYMAAINFGPIDHMNLASSLQFWPDPLNLVHRKFKRRVDGSNTDISPQSLNKAGIAIQGFSGLEYLLFDDYSNLVLHDDLRCKLILGTLKNLSSSFGRINDEWLDHYAEQWLGGNMEQSDPGRLKHNLENLFSGVVMSLDSIITDGLGLPLGINSKSEDEALNPWLLESWRSQTSLNNVVMRLKFANDVYGMDRGLGWYLNFRSARHQSLDQELRLLLNETLEIAAAIDSSAFELINSNQVDDLMQLRGAVIQVRDSLKADYSRATNLDFRFNSRDGD